MEDTAKYKVADLPIDGVIREIDALIPYKNGNGFFRNIIVAVKGPWPDVDSLVPVTLFGDDAAQLDPDMDAERPIKTVGKLMSRRYIDKSGNPRWALSLTGSGVQLGPRVSEQPSVKDIPPQRDEDDDIPF